MLVLSSCDTLDRPATAPCISILMTSGYCFGLIPASPLLVCCLRLRFLQVYSFFAATNSLARILLLSVSVLSVPPTTFYLRNPLLLFLASVRNVCTSGFVSFLSFITRFSIPLLSS